ncbi:F-box only protein 44-like isoform X2 [Sceloporus undulatus]|uniref:F-box only protein 44-like isoform X2 n=1 Tax=Sceloporus undulatus TaxID=8520 RepID=UPI001C4AC606|nr:F-box only protein 44-like isoform X2 [Sceloporus undulatus]
MVTIEDLPEIVLVEILSWVPRKELILNCRLVCSCWRDLVDLPFLWKRKCQRMGFYPETSSDTFQDWRTLCFLKCIRNLVKNPCGEEGLYFWYLDWNRWTASLEIMPTERIQLERLYNYKCCIPMPRPPQDIQRCFIFTCQKSCSSEYAYKGQHICLREKGYSDRLMDEFRPIIRVKACFCIPLTITLLEFASLWWNMKATLGII